MIFFPQKFKTTDFSPFYLKDILYGFGVAYTGDSILLLCFGVLSTLLEYKLLNSFQLIP